MSLIKLGSQLRIAKTASSVEDLVMDKPLEENVPSTKIIESKHSDFLYYRARAISAGDFGPLQRDGSRGWNYNGNYDYFPRKQLESSYDTFVGRNIFLDHNSESSLYSVGKIIDAVPVDDPETGEFYIELVGKIDRTLHPEICRKIETGELNSTSMGCSVDESKCSVCGHVLHSDADDKCDHLSSFGLGKKFQAEIDLPEYNIHTGDMVPAFSINSGIVFNEDSIVGVPADPSAVIKTVLSNMKYRLSKKASLSSDEQLDLAAQMEKLFEKLDESTKTSLKAEFCGICPPVEKESSMADKNVTPNDEQKKILSKISAYEMEQLESYVQHKTKKANELVNKEVVADATKKEETFLSKIVAKVKDSFAAQLLEKKIETVAKEELKAGKFPSYHGECPVCKRDLDMKDGKCSYCGTVTSKEDLESRPGKPNYASQFKRESISAKFQEDKNNVLDSTWSVYDDDKVLLGASLKDIWGSQFELLSFNDQKWATSDEYAKEVVARYNKEGLEKLADLWDVTHKLNKTANGPELGPDGSFAKPTTGTNNKEHNVKNSPVTKPGQESAQKGQSAPAAKEVKTETKLDMPGQEEGQKGPAAPKAKEVKTDYSEPKPEAEGKEVKTTPKNPDEKDAKKSGEEVETSYVAKGTEEMEAEEKNEKKSYKEQNALIKWSTMSSAAQEFIKKHVEKHIKEDGMERAQAVAAAYSEARGKGMDVPAAPKEASTLPIGTKAFGDAPVESSKDSTLPEGTKQIGDVPEESVKKEASQETIMEKKATDKPAESVDGSTLPDGKESMGDKAEESVKGETQPKGSAPTAEPDMSVEDGKGKKTTDLTKAPEESVDGTTLPSDKKTSGDKSEQSSKEDTEPQGTKSMGDEADSSVNKSAATEIPMPEEHKEEVKVEEKPLDLPVDGPKVEAPHEEVSAFDKAEKLDIGDGYSAHKDKESKEIIIEKDSKEVKRLPDGFGKEVGEVLKLMKAVLGLPAEEAAPAIPAASPEVMAPKVDEHPALEEAHEDELGIKESALKVREAELQKKEAELKALEDAKNKEEATKKFASILQVRSERCRKIVAELVDKEQLSYDKTVYEAELKNGAHLLDARKKAFEASINSKMKEFIALNDDALNVMEATVKSLNGPATTNTKKASRLFVSPQYNAQMSEEEEIAKIFKTMGTKNRPV